MLRTDKLTGNEPTEGKKAAKSFRFVGGTPNGSFHSADLVMEFHRLRTQKGPDGPDFPLYAADFAAL
jgi:hypothetical protein